MASPAPTVGYLSRFRNSPQYAETRQYFEQAAKSMDWSTPKASLKNIQRFTEKRAEYFHRMNVDMRDPTKTADETYKLRRLGEVMEKIVEALQKWHFDQFGPSQS